MYKLFIPPFPSETVSQEGVAIYRVIERKDGSLQYRLVIHSHTRFDYEVRLEWFRATVDDLNYPPSWEYKRLLLISIGHMLIRAEAQSERERMAYQRSYSTFRADFGRMDIGINPGWGRD